MGKVSYLLEDVMDKTTSNNHHSSVNNVVVYLICGMFDFYTAYSQKVQTNNTVY